MTGVQKFFCNILPGKWFEDMKSESMRWHYRCLTCGATKSVWDAGGIRWKAASYKKRQLVSCSHCHAMKWAAVEKLQDRDHSQV